MNKHLELLRQCSTCGGQIPRDSHKFQAIGVCSKKCEKTKLTAEEAECLRYLKEGINAVGYKHLALRNGPYKRVAIISDTHFPFQSNKVIKKILEFIVSFKPYFVIQIGDLYDFYSASRFPRSHDLMTPDQERVFARQGAEEMWSAIHKLSPASKKIQILGNHDNRVNKRIMEQMPDLAWAFDIKYMFEFPQVETIHDTSQELILDGVCYQHGHTQMGKHVEFNLMDSVHGHTHRGGVLYRPIRNRMCWELDVGCAADFNSKPMQYRPQLWSKWTNSFGVIDEHGPRVITVDP